MLDERQPRTGAARAAGMRTVVGLTLAACLAAAPSARADGSRASVFEPGDGLVLTRPHDALRHDVRRGSSGMGDVPDFYRDYLMPQIRGRAERIAPHEWRSADFDPRAQTAHHERLARRAERVVGRAAEKALGEFLLDVTSLGRRATALAGSLQSESVSAGERAEEQPFRLRVRVSHLAPKLELRYRAGPGSLAVSVEIDGAASLRYAPRAGRGAQLELKHDPGHDRYQFVGRIRF